MRGTHSNLLQYLVQIDYNLRGTHSNLRQYAVVVTDVTDVADGRAYRDADTVALQGELELRVDAVRKSLRVKVCSSGGIEVLRQQVKQVDVEWFAQVLHG